MLTKAVEQFLRDVHWGELDYLFIDMPPGTGDVQMGLARMLPRTDLLIVTTPALAAQKVAARAADMARRSFLRVVRRDREHERRSPATTATTYALFGAGGGQALADEIGVELLGQVPLGAGGRRRRRCRRAGGDRRRRARPRDAFRAIAERIVAEIAPPVNMAGCSARMLSLVRRGARRAPISPSRRDAVVSPASRSPRRRAWRCRASPVARQRSFGRIAGGSPTLAAASAASRVGVARRGTRGWRSSAASAPARRRRAGASASAGRTHSLATVSLSSCCDACAGGATARKKRVSKRRGDSPTGVIQWLTHASWSIARRRPCCCAQVAELDVAVVDRRGDGSAGWPSVIIAPALVDGQQHAGLLEALADGGDEVALVMPSPSAGSTLPPGNTYIPLAKPRCGGAPQHEHLEAVVGVAQQHHRRRRSGGHLVR